jgi:hypothetical protein
MRCRFCGCTQEDGCPAGCGWAAENLCTVCADFLRELDGYIEVCRRVTKGSLCRMFDQVGALFLAEPEPARGRARRATRATVARKAVGAP